MKIKKIRTNVPDWEEQLEADLQLCFEHDDKIRAFFDRYTASSVERFASEYILNKTLWYRSADYYERKVQENESLWLTLATRQLPVILQKKLFDLQCQWRAEQIKLPGVEVTCDFVYLGHDIMRCPIVPPITAEDIAMYKQYLSSEHANLDDTFNFTEFDWQNYTDLKSARQTDKPGNDFPAWYDFHNACTGNFSLMLLPDKRGEKEDFYINKWKESHSYQQDEKQASYELEIDKRPDLSVSDDTEEFIRRFDDITTMRLYHNYARTNRISEEKEDIADMLEILMTAETTVPMQAHSDWREAIRITVDNYKRLKVIDTLDTAFGQYEMNRSLNISFSTKGLPNSYIRDHYVSGILKGRRLNGEPEDLNF